MNTEVIEWIDSATHGDGWQDLEEVLDTIQKQGILRCYSIGWVIDEDDLTLTIAATWSPDYDDKPSRVHGVMTIPKVAIKVRTVVQSSYSSLG